MSRKKFERVAIVCGAILLLIILGWFFSSAARATVNLKFFAVQKADDATSYQAKKKVEDSCRAMISSYEADKLTYEQYRGSSSTEKQSWAEQAKMRANKTASTYNNFILENSFVWSGNVPKDIRDRLEYIG